MRERKLQGTQRREWLKGEFVSKLNALDNPEKKLFDALLVSGFKAERNKPIQVNKRGKFRIVDIVLEDKKLFIEVDGYSHRGKAKEDKIREYELLQARPLFSFLRFTNKEVRRNLSACVQRVWSYIHKTKKHSKKNTNKPVQKINTTTIHGSLKQQAWINSKKY